MADELERLDRLLTEIAANPVITGLADRAEDSGHVSEEKLQQLRAGQLDEAEGRRLRRHILFCPVCSTLIIKRTAEVENGKPGAKAGAAPAPHSIKEWRAPQKALIRRRLLVGAVLLVLAGAALAWILRERDPEREPRAAALAFDFKSIIGIGAEGTVRESRVGATDREIGVAISLATERPLYVYILLVGPDRRMRLLHPAGGAHAEARRFDELVWLPETAAAGRAPRRGFAIDDLDCQAGEAFAVLIFASMRRLSIFEDEVVTESTLPRLADEYMPKSARLTREELVDFCRRLRAARLSDSFEQLIVQRD